MIVFALLLLAPRISLAQAEPPDFNRDIRPILSGNCFKCHGPDAAAREADLRLDLREEAVDYGALVPGEPDESSLIERVSSDDTDTRMPPDGDRLSAGQVARLKAWIEGGAKYDEHWAYQRPIPPARPAVQNPSWPASEIDFFILNRIEQAGLAPSTQAEPSVLLRRLYLDLIGLPPSIDEVNGFETDPSRKNYEAYVDRLLESKHFGEKWAAGWLDLARYADSNGYQHDDLRTMWPYRDWVIHALNDDLPFDQFTIEQLAGDLLPNPSESQLIATGFHRNVPTNFSGGTKVPEIRANILHDRVATTGTVWLGMTLECCQCHDHKFDAVTQREYYQLYAYFNQAIPEVAQKGKGMFKKLFVGREVLVYASDADKQRAEEIRQNIATKQKLLEEPEQTVREKDTGGALDRTNEIESVVSLNSFDSATIRKAKHSSIVKRIDELKQELSRLATATMVMQDEDQPTATHVMIRGDYSTPGDRVETGVPAALHPLDPSLPSNRLGLAKWLAAAENPLTARVAANRIWAEIFGQGIVTTLDDFGMQGAAPTHPKLLDWLAVRFVKERWSVKRLIKTIVMSSTYQQTSTASAVRIHKDPNNEFYARGPRFRLPAELVRDTLLTLSGLMADQVGGKPAYPVQPNGLWMEIQGVMDVKIYPTSDGEDRHRRGIYTVWRRGNPYPSMINFDAPDRSRCTAKRDRSNTPIQALTLLNDPVYVEMAIAYSKIIESWDGSDRDKVIRAFRSALARHPNDKETDTLLELYRKHQSWFAVTQVLLNLDETITKS